MTATLIAKAIKETLWNYTDDSDYKLFQDESVVGVMEAGYREALHSRTTVSLGFSAEEFPAIQIKCDHAPGDESQNTTNETDHTRHVFIQVVNRSTDVNECEEDADYIRNYIQKVLLLQKCMVDGENRQRDLLSQQSKALGGVSIVVKGATPLPYQPFQVDRKFWMVVMGLDVTVFYIESDY